MCRETSSDSPPSTLTTGLTTFTPTTSRDSQLSSPPTAVAGSIGSPSVPWLDPQATMATAFLSLQQPPRAMDEDFQVSSNWRTSFPGSYTATLPKTRRPSCTRRIMEYGRRSSVRHLTLSWKLYDRTTLTMMNDLTGFFFNDMRAGISSILGDRDRHPWAFALLVERITTLISLPHLILLLLKLCYSRVSIFSVVCWDCETVCIAWIWETLSRPSPYPMGQGKRKHNGLGFFFRKT